MFLREAICLNVTTQAVSLFQVFSLLLHFMIQKFEIGRLCFHVLFEIERIPTAIFLARKLGSRGNIGQDPLSPTQQTR